MSQAGLIRVYYRALDFMPFGIKTEQISHWFLILYDKNSSPILYELSQKNKQITLHQYQDKDQIYKKKVLQGLQIQDLKTKVDNALETKLKFGMYVKQFNQAQNKNKYHWKNKNCQHFIKSFIQASQTNIHQTWIDEWIKNNQNIQKN